MVKTASSFMSYNGLPYALEGDLVDCPACGHEGTIQCVAPRHGFELPPTTFAALTFGKSVLETISTSPMLEARRFPEAVEILGQVQARFQAGGWVPWVGNQNGWYDLSPQGRKTLRAELMRYSQSDQFLDVPMRIYGLSFASSAWNIATIRTTPSIWSTSVSERNPGTPGTGNKP